jgi:hypothetical protein
LEIPAIGASKTLFLSCRQAIVGPDIDMFWFIINFQNSMFCILATEIKFVCKSFHDRELDALGL